MSDYISREDVVNAINSTPFTMSMFINKDQCVGARQARDSLALIVKKSIPAADVRPNVTAEWYGEADGYADGELVYDMWSCPICGKRFEEWEEKPDWNFCPNCGADMREEQNDAT